MFYHCVAFVIDVMTVKEEVRRSFFHSKNYEDKKIDHFARRASALGSRVFCHSEDRKEFPPAKGDPGNGRWE